MMLYLVIYDIEEERVNKVAKVCEKYGVRVQNSVFEMRLEKAKFLELKLKLASIIKYGKDSVRFYKITRWNDSDLEILGAEEAVEITKKTDIIL